MSVKQSQMIEWTTPGETLKCDVEGQQLGLEDSPELTLTLEVEEVLEQFERRRVLVASATDVDADQTEPDEKMRRAVLQPTYVIEETTRLDNKSDGWPDEVRRLVRQPVFVGDKDGLRRSVFVDNVGLSVGDIVDLLRGELNLNQITAVFRSVAELMDQLHAEGWVHLGLTPWNVRLYDERRDDGFPREFLADALDRGENSDDVASTDSDEQPADAAAASEQPEQDNPFGVGQERTVVELNPLGGSSQVAAGDDSEDDGAESSADYELEEVGREDSAAPSLATGDTEPSEQPEQQKQQLRAILDGIDRLYPAGGVDDEIAVTPGFSAPELLSGMGSEDGESADIFSLGMFLYFLVAGAVPPASVYTRYAPAIPARNFRPNFVPGLQSVISRATRPQPEERFASVETMLEAFDDACAVMDKRRQVTPQSAPVMEVASDTHIGIAKRERNPTNQDSVFSASSEDDRFALIVVADGVSTASYGSGDLASSALTDAARQTWEEILPAYLMDEEFDEVEIIRQILNRANETIVDYVNDHYTPFRGSPHEVMGSTALVAVVVDGLVTLGSLGDSRTYLQRGAGMEQITIDHNLWTLSILEGVEADQALAMPHGDALARCLGTFVVEDGILEAVEPEPDLFQFQVTDGDTLLMTTDGLVDFAGTNLLAAEDNILSVLLSEPNPALACLEFILMANRGGGGDNIGLSVARFY